MDDQETKKEDILYTTEHALFYTDLLIKQCDSWLSEEEGIRNMEKRMREKKKVKAGKRFFFGLYTMF